jgi:hypothetical protein
MRSERYHDLTWLQHQRRLKEVPIPQPDKPRVHEHRTLYQRLDERRYSFLDEIPEERDGVCFWSILVSCLLTGVAVIGIILLIL